jgi:hypothetical protein
MNILKFYVCWQGELAAGIRSGFEEVEIRYKYGPLGAEEVEFWRNSLKECFDGATVLTAEENRRNTVKNPKHYIAMSGMHGCLPDHCEVFETREDAVSDLVFLFDLGRTRTARLRKESYLKLTPSAVERRQDVDFGADYCEITECDCDNPSIHSDSGLRKG